MTHLLPNRKQRILSGRISLAGFGAIVAAAALMASADQVHAGAAEKKQLSKKLIELGTDINNATSAQLASAVASLSTATPKKAAIYAGEALKSPAALQPANSPGGANGDAGAAIAGALKTSFGATLTGSVLQNALGVAAKTATTGPGLDATRVPTFSQAVLTGDGDANNDTTDALAAATIARASKTAVGAVIGGRALEVASDLAELELAKQALGQPKLQGAASEIAKYVGVQVSDAFIPTFATNLAVNSSKLTLNIAPGAAASHPEQAGAITDALLDNGTLAPIVVKGAPTYAKNVGAVADIEQISLIGGSLARQATLPFSKGAGLAKTLAAAILAKSTGTDFTVANKADEIPEVAAYITAGILANSKITDKNRNSTVLGIIKSAIAGGKSTKKTLKDIAAQLAATNYIADVAGSVALTVQNFPSLSDAQKASVLAFLTKNVKQIAGKSATVQAQVNKAISLAATNSVDANKNLENGNNVVVATIVDPITDSHEYLLLP